MWFLRRRVQVDRLPAGRVTVQFEFRDADKHCFWLVLHRPEVDLCLADPGFDTDLCVTTDVRTFTPCTWAASASRMRSVRGR